MGTRLSMPKFSYKVRDSRNKLQYGTMDRNTVDEVLEVLREKDLVPVDISETLFDTDQTDRADGNAARELLSWFRGPAPAVNVTHFTGQLALLLKAGIPFIESMELASVHSSRRLREIIRKVKNDILAGSTLSEALAGHPSAFNPVYLSAIQSSGHGDKLETAMEQLALYLKYVEGMKSTWKKVTLQLPLAACTIALVLPPFCLKAVVLLGFSRPENTLLPALAPAVPAARLLWQYLPHFYLSVLAVAIIITASLMFREARSLVHRLLLRAPVAGRLSRTYTLSLLCRNIAFLLERGFSLPQAVHTGCSEISNPIYRDGCTDILIDLRRGENLAASLHKNGIFPDLLHDMVKKGEQEEELEKALNNAAAFFSGEFKNLAGALFQRRIQKPGRRVAYKMVCIRPAADRRAVCPFRGPFSNNRKVIACSTLKPNLLTAEDAKSAKVELTPPSPPLLIQERGGDFASLR
jgi:type II secretory pathway component PulF